MTDIVYPTPAKDDSVIDDFHGTKVADPYRYMEDPDGEATKAFVDDENKISTAYIESCEDRETIKKGLKELWDYPKYGCPFKKGDKYYMSKNSGLQNQSVLYIQDSLKDEPRVFLDPNQLSADGTISLGTKAWSHDGQTLAYSLSESGSDWNTIKFKKVETGDDYSESLTRVKFSSIAWTHDNKGIFYSCYKHSSGVTGTEADSLKNQKMYYHVVGTPQDQDVLCVEFPDHPSWLIGSSVSDCGRYLFVTISQDCKFNLLYFCDLEEQAKDGVKGKLKLTPIVEDKFDADYDYIGNQGTNVIFQTNKNAKNFKLISVDLNNPAESAWVDVLAEDEHMVLHWAAAVAGDKLITCYMKDVKDTMQLRKWNGKIITNFNLDIGSITGFSGDIRYNEIFYQFSSQITPGTIYRADISNNDVNSELHIKTVVGNFNSDDFKVEQVFYPSKDGTKIPMFITMRKDFVPDGTSPCLLYGYGGFSISLSPSFNITRTYFVQHFGIVAIPNIRGGGEYGEEWSNQGKLANLQNCLTDFQCAAEYLIKEKYTTNSKIIQHGGSHGGMLVGACTNQRPDLYGASIAAVGVMDMLRFQKHTIGYAWVSNYGCSDKPEEFENLYKISPLHNIKAPETGGYPAVLLLTADHDDRVVPSHSLKYIATLQEVMGKNPNQKKPLLILVDTKAGHGGGKPSSKIIEEFTNMYSFLVKAIDMKLRD